MTRLMCTAAVVLFATSSFAQACDYCQKEVTLTQKLANCYLGMYEDELARMKEGSLPAQLINLASCDDEDGETRGNATLPTVAQPTAKELTKTFLLDETAIQCLATELRGESWTAVAETQEGPVKTFEVKRDC